MSPGVRGALARLRQTRPVDALVELAGPAVLRIPLRLRRRLVRQGRVRTAAPAQVWVFGQPEQLPQGDAVAAALTRPTRRLPAPFVAELHGVRLVGAHATPVTAGGRVLLSGFRDQVSMLATESAVALELLAAVGAATEPEAELLVSLVGRLDLNYFHWLTDFCTQVEALQHYIAETGRRPAVLVREGAPAFVADSLRMLGWPADEIWPAPWTQAGPPVGSAVRRVGTLVLPSWRNTRHRLSHRAVRWLQARLVAPPAAVPTRIFVHREGWRSLADGDRLRERLEAEGFLTVRPERLSFAEQQRVFGSAEVIVGLHGAGLANLLLTPRARLVELKSAYGGDEYWSLAAALGSAYTRVDVDGQLGADGIERVLRAVR